MSDCPTPYSSNKFETKDSSPLSGFSYEQGSLFSEGIQRSARVYDSGMNYEMGSQSLQLWKQAIAKYQDSITKMLPVSQTSLFKIPSSHCDPHAINPFSLTFQPAEFYRLPSADAGDACLYFVIDLVASSQLPVSSTRPRQQLEKSLIAKWRSPFNKENWNFWGTPFVS